MHLIDVDALMEAINTYPKFGVDERCRIVPWNERYEPYIRLRDAVIAITGMPTIEPERKKGKWIHGREMARETIRDCTTAIFYEGWTCSECGCLVEKEREPWYKYCPNCGSYNGGDKDDQR